MSVPGALLRAASQLNDPALLRVLAKSLALTFAIFAGLGAGLFLLVDMAMARAGIAPINGASVVLSILATLVAGWLLFRIVALAVIQFFADEVVQAVEQRHYPLAAQQARQLPFREDIRNGLRSAGRAALANLIAAPFAIALLFTAIGPAIVFLAVNAVLLGRELQELAWARHRAPAESRPGSGKDAQQPLSASTRLALGAAVAAMLAVPFLNLLAPILGAAASTHLVQRAREPA